MKRIALILMALSLAICNQAFGQEKYPSRSITMIVGFAAGGGGDVCSRFIADAARVKLGVPVVVENKPGAGATIATGQIARAKPDGYTIGLATPSPLAVTPYFQTVPYDPEKSFTYIGQYLVIPHPAFVRADSPFKTWKDLIDYAKANPGKLRWATAAARGGPHIATEAALKKEGVKATYVPFGGGSEAVTALLGNHIEMLIDAYYAPFLESGKIRLLAEIGPNKMPGMPDIPTYKELNYPLVLTMYYGLIGPAGLPAEVIATWEKVLQEIMATPAWADFMKTIKASSTFQNSENLTKSSISMYQEVGRQVQSLGLK